ncbi:hypothetical protein SANTM175S_05039 [Streptomyces antimycoticus]
MLSMVQAVEHGATEYQWLPPLDVQAPQVPPLTAGQK